MFSMWSKDELKNIKKEEELQSMVIYYILLLPLITSACCASFKFFDDCNAKKISKVFIFLFTMSIIQIVAFIIGLYLLVGYVTASVIVGISIVVLYIGV